IRIRMVWLWQCELVHTWATRSWAIGRASDCRNRRDEGEKMKNQKLIGGGLGVCATIVLVVGAITRHVNNKQDAAWCYDNGYAHYATTDGFCVGARGKLIKVDRL